MDLGNDSLIPTVTYNLATAILGDLGRFFDTSTAIMALKYPEPPRGAGMPPENGKGLSTKGPNI